MPTLTMLKICVALLAPAVAVKGTAVEGKMVTAGPLTAWTGLPEMAKPWQHAVGEVTPVLKGDPGISVKLPVCWLTW